jgi:hypothetical protein
MVESPGFSRGRSQELTDEQYERIEHLLPEVEGRGCPYNDHLKVTGGIFWAKALRRSPAGCA